MTAWLPPLPPQTVRSDVPVTVSPGRGRRGVRTTRSMFDEPTTQTCGVMGTTSERRKTEVYGNRTHWELCSNPPLVLKTRALARGANTPNGRKTRGNIGFFRVNAL